jgi:hypothetical protein
MSSAYRFAGVVNPLEGIEHPARIAPSDRRRMGAIEEPATR